MNQFISGVLVAAAVLATSPASSEVSDFYHGKTITIVVGYGPGGGYDINARVFARFFGAHVPGNPTVVIQNMPGAASLRATNYISTNAPRDGSVLGTFDRNMPLMALISGSSNVKFDPLKLTWLGTVSDLTDDAFVLWSKKRLDVKDVRDLRRPGGPTLTVGVTNTGSSDSDVAVLLRDVLGLRLNIVAGYPDSAAIGLAVERGEVDAELIGYSVGGISKPAWLDPNGPMQVLLQFARQTRLPALPNVPTAREIASDQNTLQLIKMAELPYLVSRPIAGPPGIPLDRAKALQTAFKETVTDPEFLAECARLNLPVTPLDAEHTLAAVQSLADAPKELRKRLHDILYVDSK